MRKKEKVIKNNIITFKIIEFEPKLISGYKNRVQKFIYNMIYEPCKIVDSTERQFSFRPSGSYEKGKIKLKPFITDYTRVNNYLSKQKEELEKYPQRDKKTINYNLTDNINFFNTYNSYRNNNINDIQNNYDEMPKSEEYIENKYFYLQPVMKFAPRTEFERIFDTLNSYNYGRVDRNLITEQLKTLGLLTVQSNRNIESKNEYSLLKEKFKVSGPTLSYLIKEKARLEKEEKTPENLELLSNITDIIKINKEIKYDQETPKMPVLKTENHKKLNIAQRKIINNYLAKNILGEYQKKTHFKALLNCTLNLEKEKNEPKHKSLSDNNRAHTIYPQNFKNSTLNNYSGNNKIIRNTCFKPFHNKKKYPKEDMEYLKKLCNMTQNEYFKPKIQITDINKANDEGEEEPNKYVKHANTVLINGVAYNKKDLAKISKVILKECNYIKHYFDKEKAGAGKTMITRGLSVEEFTKKYGLPK